MVLSSKSVVSLLKDLIWALQHFLSNFQNLQPRIVLNLFLGFGRISASCSYKIVLIKKACSLMVKFKERNRGLLF